MKPTSMNRRQFGAATAEFGANRRFDALNDGFENLNRFDWILTCRRFARQHYRIGTLAYGVGNVRDFGASRHR